MDENSPSEWKRRDEYRNNENENGRAENGEMIYFRMIFQLYIDSLEIGIEKNEKWSDLFPNDLLVIHRFFGNWKWKKWGINTKKNRKIKLRYHGIGNKEDIYMHV